MNEIIDSLIHLTRIYSEETEISFGIGKCGRIIKGGKVAMTNEVDLPSKNIADIQVNYKCLGIL